jgi:hypothetical protein
MMSSWWGGWKRWFVARRWTLAIGAAVFIAAALAFRLGRGAFAFWTMDDAGITFAQSLELVDHHSLAPSLEGTPVEGYSNPLVFFVAAGLRMFGAFDPITTHLHLEMLLFATMVTLVWSMLRAHVPEAAAILGAAVFATVELLTLATSIWYGSGLENVWVSCGLVTLVWICARTARGVPLSPVWGNVAFLVAITRPEGPVYVVAFYLGLLVLARPPGVPLNAHAKRVARALVVTIALYAAFLVWRRWAYSAWWPNTYYAKLHDPRSLVANLRDYIVHGILPYGQSALFATSVIALACVPKKEALTSLLALFVVASLALPLTAGADWMGEHRFATQFLAMCHLSYAVLVAACLARVAQRPRHLAHVVALVGLGSITVLLALERRDVTLNRVTIGRVAHVEGAQRWEQQMRLGVPYPVVLIPDAGGTLLVGAMQMLDNGYLTDFQMSRMGRKFWPGHRDWLVLNQYQNVERRPDLVAENEQFPHDRSLLGTEYLPPGNGILWPRHDLVEVPSLDGATLLHDGGSLKIYLSPETVPFAAPHALVRCELIFAWTEPLEGKLRAHLEGGDRDELTLFPYQRTPVGFERVGILLGAPERAGAFRISFELERAGKVTAFESTTAVEVSRDEAARRRVIATILAAPSPQQVAHRLAWLREQSVRRLGMTAFHAKVDALVHADAKHEAGAGALVMELRENARLASLVGSPDAIGNAEQIAIARMFETCPRDRRPRILCTGRVVDHLRRLGYLGVRVPDRAEALDDLAPTERYRALVGMTLADPSDIALQWQLLKLRRSLAHTGTFPSL